MDPTPEQVEAVAHVLAERFDGVTLRDPSNPVDVARIHREIAEDVIAAMNAEPLTSTPEPSTTETETEGPLVPQGLDSLAADDVDEEAEERYLAAILCDPPPGFSWEYRAVNVAPDGVEQEWPWGTLEDARSVWSDYADDPEDAWIERRLVGPAERVEE